MNSKFPTSYFDNNNIPSLSQISPFIIEGEFLEQIPKIKEKYSLKNFKYITDMNNNRIKIGKGGYGKLYLARNIIDNKEYAIKNISKGKIKEVKINTSIIKREIDIHIRITHPHIIKLFSYLEDRHNYYLAMEYAQKGNLYKLIQEKRGMNENEAFNYFIQVVSAIHFLHMNGYAHRDIKPENILLDENYQVKLCDFGWCVNVSKGERITFCGTYEYMAPEMINDEFYDMGIDIWSLGVLLYEMIHGYSPFRAHYFLKDAKSAMKEIFMNIKSNNYVIERNISKECIDLIDKLLTIDPKKRIKVNEIFLHPWVVNKEKKYFPNFRRINIINDEYIEDSDIDEEINEDIFIKIDKNSYLKDNNLKNNNHQNYNIHHYDKIYPNNNGFLFVKEKNKEKMLRNEGNEEKINNIKNELVINRINDDKYKLNEYKYQNNFIHNINSSRTNEDINNIKAKTNLSEIRQNKNHNLHIDLGIVHKMNQNNYNIRKINIEQKNKNQRNDIKSHLNMNIIKEKNIERNIMNELKKEENFSFIYNKPRKDMDLYSARNLSKEKSARNIIPENKNKDKRAKSVEQSLKKINLNFTGKKYKDDIRENNLAQDQAINNNNDNNIVNNKINNINRIKPMHINEMKHGLKDDFLRFRKKVVHIKKRSFLNESNFNFTKNKEKIEDKLYGKFTKINCQKPVQNIFYNTYYNCNFDNVHDNSLNLNIDNSETYTNNFYLQTNNNIRNRNPIKKSKTDFKSNLKSYSYQKNYYKYKSNELEEKNKENDLINFCTEKKIGTIYTKQINILRNDNNTNNINNINQRYIITNGENKNKYINTRKVSPYKRKEILILSCN